MVSVCNSRFLTCFVTFIQLIQVILSLSRGRIEFDPSAQKKLDSMIAMHGKQPVTLTNNPKRSADPGIYEEENKLITAAKNNYDTVLISSGTGAYLPLALNLLASLNKISLGSPNNDLTLADSFCFVALDSVALAAFQDPTQAPGATCVIDGLKLFPEAVSGPGDGAVSSSGSTPLRFMAPEGWNSLMLYRWRLARLALRLALSVTVMDNDVALLKDPTQVFQSKLIRAVTLHQHEHPFPHTTRHHHPEPSSGEVQAHHPPPVDVVVYCCQNVGVLHFPSSAASRTGPWLDEFINNLTTQTLWEQQAFQDFAPLSLNVVDASGDFQKGDGCALWSRFIRRVQGTFTAGGGNASRVLDQGEILIHAQCWTALAFHIKVWMLKSFMAWFSEPHKYEHTKEQFLMLENAALRLDWSKRLPDDFEAAELARAMGIAIALNRTLILPFQTCREELNKGGKAPLPQAPWEDIDVDLIFPVVGPGTDPGLPMSRFCLPFDGGPLQQSTTSERLFQIPRHGKLTWQPQQVATALYQVSEKLVPLREPSFVYNPRVPKEKLEPPGFLIGSENGSLRKVGQGEALKAYMERMVAIEVKHTPKDGSMSDAKKSSSEGVPDIDPGIGSSQSACGEQMQEWVSSQGISELPLLHLASVHFFKGFKAGTVQDQKYSEVLKILGATHWYSTCA